MALKNDEELCALLDMGCESAGVLCSKDHRPKVFSLWVLSNHTHVSEGLHEQQNRQHNPKAASLLNKKLYQAIKISVTAVKTHSLCPYLLVRLQQETKYP